MKEQERVSTKDVMGYEYEYVAVSYDRKNNLIQKEYFNTENRELWRLIAASLMSKGGVFKVIVFNAKGLIVEGFLNLTKKEEEDYLLLLASKEASKNKKIIKGVDRI